VLAPALFVQPPARFRLPSGIDTRDDAGGPAGSHIPIIGLDGKLSPHLCHIIKQLRAEGFKTQLVNVPYEFQKGANQCLVVKRVEEFENDEIIDEEDI
jgi:hypothetical protein